MTVLTKKENEKIHQKVTKYSHYAFCHYLFTHSDNIRLAFCQKIMPNRKIISTHIRNASFPGDAVSIKGNILAIDDKGDYYNIEMQAYDITEGEMNRFQIYAGILLRIQSERGKRYQNIHIVRQLILNLGRPIENMNHFYHHFIIYDKEHQMELPYSKQDLHIFQPYYFEEEDKTDEVNQLMYLFKNDVIYDKIELGELVREAIKMHEQYIDSEEYWKAINDEIALFTANTRMWEEKQRGISRTC